MYNKSNSGGAVVAHNDLVDKTSISAKVYFSLYIIGLVGTATFFGPRFSDNSLIWVFFLVCLFHQAILYIDIHTMDEEPELFVEKYRGWFGTRFERFIRYMIFLCLVFGVGKAAVTLEPIFEYLAWSSCVEFLKQKEIVFEAGALFLFIFLLIWNCLAFYFRRRTRGDSLQPAVDEIADGAMTAAFSILAAVGAIYWMLVLLDFDKGEFEKFVLFLYLLSAAVAFTMYFDKFRPRVIACWVAVVKTLQIWLAPVVIVALLIFLVGISYFKDNGGRWAYANPVRVGAIVPLTGPFAAYGEPVRDGMQLAFEEINAGGGVSGRKLELVLEDDAGEPKNAVNAFIKLATVSKSPVVIGPLSSGASMAVAPLAEHYHVVMLATLAGTIDLTRAGDYVFRIYPSSEVGSRYIAKAAIDRFKAKRIAILYPNNAFGVSSREFVTEVARQAGAEIVAVETFKDGDRDFRTQLTKIAASKPDVILSSAYYEDGAQILVQARQLGLDVPVLGEDGWFGPIAQIAGDTLKNLYFANVAFGPEYQNNRVMQNFIAAFRNRFGRSPNSYSAAGYAAVFVVKRAIEVGGYDGPGIKQALYHTDMETAFGRVNYDEHGDNIGATYELFQLNDRNEPVLVRPHSGG